MRSSRCSLSFSACSAAVSAVFAGRATLPLHSTLSIAISPPGRSSSQAALVVGVVAGLVGVDEREVVARRLRPRRAARRASRSAGARRRSILCATPAACQYGRPMRVYSSLMSQASRRPSSGSASATRQRAVAGEDADLDRAPRADERDEQRHELRPARGRSACRACGCASRGFAQRGLRRVLAQRMRQARSRTARRRDAACGCAIVSRSGQRAPRGRPGSEHGACRQLRMRFAIFASAIVSAALPSVFTSCGCSRIEAAELVEDVGTGLLGMVGEVLHLLRRDLRRLLRRDLRAPAAEPGRPTRRGTAAQRREHAGVERAEDLVEHAGLLLRVCVREDRADHLAERGRLVGTQRVGDALAHDLRRRMLRHLVEMSSTRRRRAGGEFRYFCSRLPRSSAMSCSFQTGIRCCGCASAADTG